jgi:hypothetical protein
VDVILDNVGLELVSDFCLADYLLSRSQVASVHFHCKLHPTFVSDTTASAVFLYTGGRLGSNALVT